MHTAAEYREMAEECFEWASAAPTDEIRATYISIAQIWGGASLAMVRLPSHPLARRSVKHVSSNLGSQL